MSTSIEVRLAASLVSIEVSIAAPGPQGPQGIQGETGPQGDVGDVNPQMPIILDAAEEARDQAVEAAQAADENRIATGEDRLQTGLDRQATAADRVATGQDAAAAADSAAAAEIAATAASQSAADALLSEQAAAASAALVGPPVLPTIANSAAMAPGVVVESPAVTVSGSTSTVWPAVVRGDGAPEVQVNAGPWAQSAIFRSGDTVKLRNTSPPDGVNYVATLYAHSFSTPWSLVPLPVTLFAGGEQGVWYDPSDMSTMFQDRAGTTPVTAVGQPVGLILDKSKGLMLGPELVTNGDFSNGATGWSIAPVFAETSAFEWVDNSLRVYNTGASYGEVRSSAITLTLGKTYCLEADVLDGSSSSYWIVISSSATTDWQQPIVITAEQAGNGYRHWRYSFVATYETAYLWFSTSDAPGLNLYIDNISVRELPGNHATQPTATARPVLQIDGNGKHYLRFDGVDDFLVTNTITPGTDKAQVFAGVRDSSVNLCSIVETSTITGLSNGSFGVYGNLASNGDKVFALNTGSSFGYRWSGLPATFPNTDVLSIQMDGATGVLTSAVSPRIDGSPPSLTDSGAVGVGNFLAYPLYIGRQGGTYLPFNGQMYSMIVRFGSNLSNEQITQAENWVNEKTGAY